jgi:uncharacterized protein (TIGR03032 family)
MAHWLLSQHLSLAYTSYATGRLIVAGVAPEGRLFFNEQNYRRAMGLHYHGRELHVASQHQIWRLSDLLAPGEFANGAFDCVLTPRHAHTTGYLDVHELGVDGAGRPIFVNTKYSCLATTDPDYSFRPVWKPPFITELAPEDRCHLNGLAMVDGVPRYVTAFDRTDTKGGWREGTRDQGVVLDVASGEVVASGLYMPHSPRVHEGNLWVLESGRGYLVRVDIQTGKKTDVAFCPGFVRGLALTGKYAVVAVSKARENSSGLPLHEELRKHDAEPWCAILVVDLELGLISNFIRYDAQVTELFDVALLPGIRNPMTIGPSTEEVLQTIRFNPEFGSVSA